MICGENLKKLFPSNINSIPICFLCEGKLNFIYLKQARAINKYYGRINIGCSRCAGTSENDLFQRVFSKNGLFKNQLQVSWP